MVEKSQGFTELRVEDVIRICALLRAGHKGRSKVMRGYRLTLDEVVWIEQQLEAEFMIAESDTTLERHEEQQLRQAAED